MPPKRSSRSVAAIQAPPAPLPEAPAPITLPRPEGLWKALAYLAAFLQPALGLAFAFFYWRVARFGKICLALAIVGMILSAGGEAMQDGLKGGEWFIQPY